MLMAIMMVPMTQTFAAENSPAKIDTITITGTIIVRNGTTIFDDANFRAVRFPQMKTKNTTVFATIIQDKQTGYIFVTTSDIKIRVYNMSTLKRDLRAVVAAVIFRGRGKTIETTPHTIF